MVTTKDDPMPVGAPGEKSIETTPTASDTPTPPNSQATARPQVEVDDVKASAGYCNFCRVTGTPEELIVDFGLNCHPMQAISDPIPISQRVVMNFYTAKRLLAALQMSIQRHEAAFGVLETDVQKRVSPIVRRALGQS
jgi:hypothetical protein